MFHHVGVYAYRPAALTGYADWPEGVAGAPEGLEQLRFLERGRRSSASRSRREARLFWELNNPEDVPRIEEMLIKMELT